MNWLLLTGEDLSKRTPLADPSGLSLCSRGGTISEASDPNKIQPTFVSPTQGLPAGQEDAEAPFLKPPHKGTPHVAPGSQKASGAEAGQREPDSLRNPEFVSVLLKD